jgi:hypothetical protein
VEMDTNNNVISFAARRLAADPDVAAARARLQARGFQVSDAEIAKILELDFETTPGEEVSPPANEPPPIEPAPTVEAPIDRALRKLMQLDIMLQLVFAGGADNFNNLEADARDTYLWACHDQVKEALDAVNACWAGR